MSLSVCPVAVVHAPAEAVWELMSHPETYTSWSDAIVDHVDPPGAAQAGQKVEAHAEALGLKRPVHIEVRAVDPGRRTLDLTTSLPFGITVLNHITITPLEGGSCQVSFG